MWADRRPPQRQSCLRNGTKRLVTLLMLGSVENTYLNLLTAIFRNTPRSYFLVHVPCYIFFHRLTVFGFWQSAADNWPTIGRQSVDTCMSADFILYSIEPLIIDRCVGRKSPASKAICRRSANCKVLWLIKVIGVVCL